MEYKVIKELYVEDIGTVEVHEQSDGYNYFERIEQINETTYAGYRGGKIAQTWNARYVIRVTFYENEN